LQEPCLDLLHLILIAPSDNPDPLAASSKEENIFTSPFLKVTSTDVFNSLYFLAIIQNF
jgi:hypothetical protein